jgi:hypothetical protein
MWPAKLLNSLPAPITPWCGHQRKRVAHNLPLVVFSSKKYDTDLSQCMEHKVAKKTVTPVFSLPYTFSVFVKMSHQSSAMIRPGRPAVSGHSRDTWDYGFSVKTLLQFFNQNLPRVVKSHVCFLKFRGPQQLHAKSRQSSKGYRSSTGLTSVKENVDKMTILSRLSETVIHLCSVATWEWQKTKMAELLLALLLPYIITRVVSNQRSNAHRHWLWGLEHLGPKGIQLTFCHVRIAPGSK